MKITTTNDVWSAISSDPVEAANLAMRSELMTKLERAIETWGVTHAEAAVRLKISRPMVTDLLNGKINKFGLDLLVKLAARAGSPQVLVDAPMLHAKVRRAKLPMLTERGAYRNPIVAKRFAAAKAPVMAKPAAKAAAKSAAKEKKPAPPAKAKGAVKRAAARP